MAKKQGYNARLDDSLGSKNGKKKQSMKDRRDESEGMEKSKGNRKFSGNKSTDRKVKKVAKELGKKASPAKMYGKKKSPAKMNGGKVKATVRKDVMDSKGNVTKGKTKSAKAKKITEAQFNSKATARKAAKSKAAKAANAKAAREAGYMYNYNTRQYEPTPNKEGARRRKESGLDSPMKMSGRSYDMKEAYNKDLSPSARLHYLENERHDKDSPMKMYHKSPNKMEMSPLEKELVGKQHNLPEHLKSKIEASPAKMSRELSYGGPVIDQEPKALSHMGASKVLRHMHGSKHSPLNMNGGPGKPKGKMAQGDTVRGFDKYNVGDMVSEDDFESKFKKKGNNPKNYPQLSVQDYSVVKKDARGKYVNRLKD